MVRCGLTAGAREIRTAGPQDGVLFRVYLSAAAAPLGTFCRQYADRARICLPAKPLCPIIRENEIDATLLLSLTPDDLKGHRQLGICRLPEGAMGLSDARRYA